MVIYFTVGVLAFCVMAGLAVYAYGPRNRDELRALLGSIGSKLLKAYNHLRHLADRIAERGWRRCFGWLGVLVGYYTFIYAPSNGIAVDTNAVNIFLTMVTGTFVARGVEQVARTRNTISPTGGLVNNQAIS